MYTDKMVDKCQNIFSKLNIFLGENKEFQETKEYKFIATDTKN